MAKERHFWIYPTDDITTGVWVYLRARYQQDDAEGRREVLTIKIRQLSSMGIDIPAVHDALNHSVHLWMNHERENYDYKRWALHVKPMRTAHRLLVKAIKAIRDAGFGGTVEMEAVLSMRDALDMPTLPRRKAGRPWGPWTYLNEELHGLHVERLDASEIGQQLGLVPPDSNSSASVKLPART